MLLGVDLSSSGVSQLSYAGYITVQPQWNSNTFFWFWPSQDGNTDAPIIIWMNGGNSNLCTHSNLSYLLHTVFSYFPPTYSIQTALSSRFFNI